MDPEAIKIIEEKYGFKIVEPNLLGGYFKRVWSFHTSDGQELVYKYLPDQDEKDWRHHKAEVAFSKAVNELSDIKTVTFIPDKNGETIHQLDKDTGDCFVLLEKHLIVKRQLLSPELQQNLGHLMSEVHSKFKGFTIEGLNYPNYMRVVDDAGLGMLYKDFPDKGFEPYLQYMKPLDYKSLGWDITIIHGDWHQENFSYTEPPFLFDLDTLSIGSRVDEIARTLTHWAFPTIQAKEYFDNITDGYEGLTNEENDLIPKLMVAQLYRKYVEFHHYNDPFHVEQVRGNIPIVKKLFGLK